MVFWVLIVQPLSPLLCFPSGGSELEELDLVAAMEKESRAARKRALEGEAAQDAKEKMIKRTSIHVPGPGMPAVGAERAGVPKARVVGAKPLASGPAKGGSSGVKAPVAGTGGAGASSSAKVRSQGAKPPGAAGGAVPAGPSSSRGMVLGVLGVLPVGSFSL